LADEGNTSILPHFTVFFRLSTGHGPWTTLQAFCLPLRFGERKVAAEGTLDHLRLHDGGGRSPGIPMGPLQRDSAVAVPTFGATPRSAATSERLRAGSKFHAF